MAAGMIQLPLLALVICGSVLANVHELFLEFERVFTPNYPTATVREERLKIFTANVDKIAALNARDPHAQYTYVTPWADLTDEEFKGMHGLAPEMVCQFAKPPPKLSPTETPQDSLDYVELGATVEVKNQGSCGSCWAHATTAVVEARLKLDTGKTASLSEQYLLDCDKTRICQGCCGGLPERALQWLAGPGHPGIASEEQYPYASASGTDPTEGICNTSVPRVAQVTGFGLVAGDSKSMLAASTEYGVLSVAMDSAPLQFYQSGVITNPSCSSSLSNHAVAIVGYGVDGDVAYWKVRNSYGTQFGEDGYFRIERSSGQVGAPCGISGCVTAATGAAAYSPGNAPDFSLV